MTDAKKKQGDKPLDKMTVKELREVAKELPDITGAHGMKKDELLTAIKATQGDDADAGAKPAEADAGAKPVEADAGAKPAEADAGAKPVEADAGAKPADKAETKSAPEAPAAAKKKGSAKDKKGQVTVKEIKKLIKTYKYKRRQALDDKDSKMAAVFRRRISRLKKKTRRAA